MVVKRFHVPMVELTPKERSEVAQEVKLVAHLRHPNVIAFKVRRSFLGGSWAPEKRFGGWLQENFVENGVMHIIMEYATGGTLHKKIQEREGELFPEASVFASLRCPF